MRELTKSILSYSWAVSIYGVQQLTNVLVLGADSAASARAIDQMTAEVVRSLNPPMRTTFAAGDGLQRTVVDVLSGGWGAPAAPPAAARPVSAGPSPVPRQDTPAAPDPLRPLTPRTTWGWDEARAPQYAPLAKAS